MRIATTILAAVFLIGCGHDKVVDPHAGHVRDAGAVGSGGAGGSAGGGGAGAHTSHGTGGAQAVAPIDAAADAVGTAADAEPEADTADAGTPPADVAPDTADAQLPDAGTESGGPPPPACDGVWPVCKPPIPSYARDVAPILNAKCNNCHSPDPGKPWPLDTYANVTAWSADVSDALARCNMPPPDGGTPPLTPAEHDTIANWLACAAPDN